MTTRFANPDSIKAYVRTCRDAEFGDGAELTFEEIPELKVRGMDTSLLNFPDTPSDVKEAIQAQLDAQVGYRVLDADEEQLFRIVIAPFRDGYCLWLLGDGGHAIRV
jgi:hypothetical protein